MKRLVGKWLIIGIVMVCSLTACTSPKEEVMISDMIEKEPFIRVELGERYHQNEILIDVTGDRSVVPYNAKWGNPSVREGEEIKVYHGDEEGSTIYEDYKEFAAGLKAEEFMNSIDVLKLTEEEVQKQGYNIKVVDDELLKHFQNELENNSTLTLKNKYNLMQVDIKFDDQCRPIAKKFILKELEPGNKQGAVENTKECVQKFSYEMSERKFEKVFNDTTDYIKEQGKDDLEVEE